METVQVLVLSEAGCSGQEGSVQIRAQGANHRHGEAARRKTAFEDGRQKRSHIQVFVVGRCRNQFERMDGRPFVLFAGPVRFSE